MMKTKNLQIAFLPVNKIMSITLNRNNFLFAKKIILMFFFLNFHVIYAQQNVDTSILIDNKKPSKNEKAKIGQVYYGIASFYGDKFIGKKTASGEIFSQEKNTAACNILPLGTWIKVTNTKNHKSVIVKTNDRLHPKMNRIVDLSKIAAQKIGLLGNGLVKVKIEVIKKPNHHLKK